MSILQVLDIELKSRATWRNWLNDGDSIFCAKCDESEYERIDRKSVV